MNHVDGMEETDDLEILTFTKDRVSTMGPVEAIGPDHSRPTMAGSCPGQVYIIVAMIQCIIAAYCMSIERCGSCP